MNRKHIRIVIAADGTTSIEAMNFIGPHCKNFTLEIAELLGGTVLSDVEKPEARARERIGQQDREAAR